MKAREVKRAKLVAKYAAKRAALKEAGDYAALDKLPIGAPGSRWIFFFCKHFLSNFVCLRVRFGVN